MSANNEGGRERTRRKVRERDNYTCQDCGFKRTPEEVSKFNQRIGVGNIKGKIKSLDVHHLNGICGKMSRKYDPISTIDGLITLCHRCHFNRHDWSKRELLDSNRKKIVDSYNSGLSAKEVSKKFGIHKGTVLKNVRRSGCKVRKNIASIFVNKCPGCKQTFETKRKSQKFCLSIACREHRHLEALKRAKIQNCTRVKRYYHEVIKKLPNWREVIRERNLKAKLRRTTQLI